MMHRVIAILVILSTLCNGKKDGAPTGSCDSMMPAHSSNVGQTTQSPYQIAVNRNMYKKGDTLTVSLYSTTDKFKGYIIQVRSGNGEKIPGLSNAGQPNSKLMACTSPNDAVTHSDASEKSNVTFTFVAPESTRGDLTVYATVVKDYSTFWVKMPSSVIKSSSTGVFPSLIVLFCLLLCSVILKKL